ncbi:hypothetical protein [Xenorhabdus bovienii]|uniref:hypothetical protein n=1 Tax=Xenorhabdus bovienii TaxID=40576 RepID=UPI0023B31599|nr:hypothetical protein [Xenorhabdus bovienii]MDE9541070.1 hypothetical protein [Xenorhabdus bovienii]
MYLFLLGAPGTGKSTLGPLLNATIRLNQRCWHLDLMELNILLDRIIKYFSSVSYLQPTRELLRSSLETIDCRLLEYDVLSSLSDDDLKCAEVDNVKGFRDEEGSVVNHFVSKANSYIQWQLYSGECNVIIPGTGMNLHRLLPLLILKRNEFIKVVVPDKELHGYYKNNVSMAIHQRSTPASIAEKKFVPALVMYDIYLKQQRLLASDGIWAKINGFFIAQNLTATILRELASTELTPDMQEETIAIYNQLVHYKNNSDVNNY